MFPFITMPPRPWRPPWRWLLGALALAAIVAVAALVGCSRAPTGLLGHRWGEAGVSTDCQPWQPWQPGTPFETCTLPPTHVLGRAARVEVIRSARGLEGYVVGFGACDASAREGLRRDVRAAFHRGGEGEIYARWDGGEVLRLVDGDGDCTLVVGGPRYGTAYVGSEIARGLGAVGRVH